MENPSKLPPLPDLTPVQIKGLVAAIPAEAATLGVPLPASVKLAVAIAIPIVYGLAMVADAIIRHGRTRALPELVAQASKVASVEQSQKIDQVATAVGGLGARVEQAEQALQQAGEPVSAAAVVEQVIARLAAAGANAGAAAPTPAETPPTPTAEAPSA